MAVGMSLPLPLHGLVLGPGPPIGLGIDASSQRYRQG